MAKGALRGHCATPYPQGKLIQYGSVGRFAPHTAVLNQLAQRYIDRTEP